jgi:hypothetical protein
MPATLSAHAALPIVKGTDYAAPHYKKFFNLLLVRIVVVSVVAVVLVVIVVVMVVGL